MSIIKELYNGNLRPAERCMQSSGDFSKLFNKINADMKEIAEEMSEDKQKLINIIEEQNAELMCISDEESFALGFRIGVMLMCDVFLGKSENFRDIGGT